MNIYDKIRAVCNPFRMVVGIVLIIIAVVSHIPWFYLGFIPLIAGITGFCPMCKITKKCSIKKK